MNSPLPTASGCSQTTTFPFPEEEEEDALIDEAQEALSDISLVGAGDGSSSKSSLIQEEPLGSLSEARTACRSQSVKGGGAGLFRRLTHKSHAIARSFSLQQKENGERSGQLTKFTEFEGKFRGVELG